MTLKESTTHGTPEEFSSVPLLTLVPCVGSVTKLDSVTSALFARYQKIIRMIRESERSDQTPAIARFTRERGMLREVLEWLSVNLDEVEL